MVSRTKTIQISQDFKNHLRAKQTSTFMLRQINRRYMLTVLILYSKGVLKTVYFYNNFNKKRDYYAVKISQTIHIFNWQHLLNQVGKSERNIPKDWDSFWEFWKQIQDNPKVNQKPDTKIKPETIANYFKAVGCRYPPVIAPV
ncbi:hypothetical protein [Nostoc sp. MG11]|uniref:hypothetical protein n=1 Tax=Nostoc sp. MG11 TaxID=2721166 RepID=UPI001865F26A|nr:hypothetical protein [Nostoc sp. MG11]